MRLRSTHFVFFVLLLCAVQAPGHLPLQWMEGAVSDSPRRAASHLEAASQRESWQACGSIPVSSRVSSGELRPAALAGVRRAWTMRLPARAAAATSLHTSLLRA